MYSRKVLKFLEKNRIKLNDKAKITTLDDEIEGVLLNRPDYLEDDTLIIKLSNGYNIGINLRNIKKIKNAGKNNPIKSVKIKDRIPKNPFISILHTGGTIASKVDYRTGGVVSRFNPDELIKMFPDLKNYGSIHSVFLGNMFSDDMRFSHYKKMAEAVKAENSKGSKGVIITHGTDTLGYTSAALSFMLENVPIPVILVGAQRSSDRGSSDAGMNLICAVKFIKKTNFKGVGICMHENSNDESCIILSGVNARKMHTSRRDAFKNINNGLIARVEYEGNGITFLSEHHNKSGKFKLMAGMSDKVGIVKIHTNFSAEQIRFFEEKKYKGLIIEGTGLGHAPISETDKLTKEHSRIRKAIKSLIDSGCVVVMCSQAINGRVNMNIYSPGRDLLNMGVVSGDTMISETAFVKLAWLLGNYKKDDVKRLMNDNLRGEIKKRLLL